MTDLGNCHARMALQCKHPDATRWPDDTTMETVALHFQLDHETDKVSLDLVPVCTCGAAMTVSGTRPTGGGFKDWLTCVCGNTGHLIRGK